MAVNEGTRRIVGGVDTHKDLHVAALMIRCAYSETRHVTSTVQV